MLNLSVSKYALLLIAIAAFLQGCIDEDQGTLAAEPPESTAAIVVPSGCAVVQQPPVQGLPSQIISPHSTIASDFTRVLYPNLTKQGSWSATQYVVDANGLSFPAITANGTTTGWVAMPFNSGETVVGVTVTVCGDPTTYIIGDTVASQFSTASLDNTTDSLIGTGSKIANGFGGVWHDVDIGMVPLLLQGQSSFWLELTAVPGSTGAPISMAVSRVVMHINH